MPGGKERGDLLKSLPRILLILFLLVVPLSKVSTAAAQEKNALVISAAEITSFPAIQFRMDAYDSQGNFLDGLKSGDILIDEDGQTQKVQTLKKIQDGLQIILVLNTASSMANQANGTSEYQLIQKALIEWAKSLPAQMQDDFSFSTPTGLFLIRQHDPQLLIKALTDYQPDFAKAQASLGSLAEAIDLATDPLDSTAMKRAILYITPALPASVSAALPDLTNRATKTGVKIHVWQVGKNSTPTADGSNPLQLLAETTGGRYQEIPQSAPLPEVEPLFQSQRFTYQVSYESTIKTSGSHSLSVQVNQAGQNLTSNSSSFNVTVQPPNPIFLSPPTAIKRTWDGSANKAAPLLTPTNLPLQILIEFPDQHSRPLKATRLFVNDKLVQENTAPPFDRFTWPLDSLTTPTRQMLRVEAVDSLGLSGSSIESPVDITIDQPAKNSLIDRVSGRSMVAIAAVTAAGGILALVLVLNGTQRRSSRNRSKSDKKRMKDPVTQPIPIRQEPSGTGKAKVASSRIASSKPVASWPVPAWPRPGAQNAPARLVALDENEQPITGGAIPLSRQEITFGADPRRATQVLESPTVDPLHARLFRDAGDIFYLADQDSIAGTWINYAPVTSNGARLEHGDLIHIGKVVFRFELLDPNRVSAIKITVTDLEM